MGNGKRLINLCPNTMCVFTQPRYQQIRNSSITGYLSCRYMDALRGQITFQWLVYYGHGFIHPTYGGHSTVFPGEGSNTTTALLFLRHSFNMDCNLLGRWMNHSSPYIHDHLHLCRGHNFIIQFIILNQLIKLTQKCVPDFVLYMCVDIKTTIEHWLKSCCST